MIQAELFFLLAFLAVFLVVALGVTLRLARTVRLQGRVYPSLARFLEQFGAEVGLKGEKIGEVWFRASLENARFTGTLANGRRARVTFVDHYDMNNWSSTERLRMARVAISCETVPQLTVTVKGFLGKLGKAFGLSSALETGDKLFDERYTVESLEPGRAKTEIQKTDLRQAIESVFAHYKLEQLELSRGEIVAHVPIDELPPEHYATLLEKLGGLARTIDELVVKVQPGEQAGTKARCGYCHDEVGADAPDVVACETCATIVHKACRAELGRCPVAGCEGKIAEKPRERARS